jgi:hypothetical protein
MTAWYILGSLDEECKHPKVQSSKLLPRTDKIRQETKRPNMEMSAPNSLAQDESAEIRRRDCLRIRHWSTLRVVLQICANIFVSPLCRLQEALSAIRH